MKTIRQIIDDVQSGKRVNKKTLSAVVSALGDRIEEYERFMLVEIMHPVSSLPYGSEESDHLYSLINAEWKRHRAFLSSSPLALTRKKLTIRIRRAVAVLLGRDE